MGKIEHTWTNILDVIDVLCQETAKEYIDEYKAKLDITAKNAKLSQVQINDIKDADLKQAQEFIISYGQIDKKDILLKAKNNVKSIQFDECLDLSRDEIVKLCKTKFFWHHSDVTFPLLQFYRAKYLIDNLQSSKKTKDLSSHINKDYQYLESEIQTHLQSLRKYGRGQNQVFLLYSLFKLGIITLNPELLSGTELKKKLEDNISNDVLHTAQAYNDSIRKLRDYLNPNNTYQDENTRQKIEEYCQKFNELIS